MVFSIDYTGQCNGCLVHDGPGTLAIVGSQLHLLIHVGIWVYSFIHREILIWTINVIASLLIGLCYIFHKVELLGTQPPCLQCVAASYYSLKGSAVPCVPVALVTFYMLFTFVAALELGSAFTEQVETESFSKRLQWERIRHLDVLIIPCWSASARLYTGLTTPRGVVSGVISGGCSILLAFAVIRSRWFRSIVLYIFEGTEMQVGPWLCKPLPWLPGILNYLGFECTLLKIMWRNLDHIK